MESPLKVEIVVGSDNPSTPVWARASRCRRTATTLAYVESGSSESQALHPTARSAPGDPVRHRRGESRPALPSVRLTRRQLDRLRAHPRRAAEGAGQRGRSAHRLQGDAQPGRHLARRRHHRVRAEPQRAAWPACPRREASRSRSPRSTRSAARSRTAGRRRYPTASTSSSLARRRGELRHRQPRGGVDRDRRAQGGVSGWQLRALRCRPATSCSSIAAPCSRSRSISTRSRPAAPRCQSSRRSPTSPNEGGAQYDFSATGRLVYAAQGADDRLSDLVGRSRRPRQAAARGARGLCQPAALSRRHAPRPDRLRDENWDIWVYDLERGVSTRLTFDEGVETEQIWSPDGEYLVFSSDRDGPDSLYRKRADGSGETERLTEPPSSHNGPPRGRATAATSRT